MRHTEAVPAAVHALVDAPWGPIHVAASDRGIVALELLSPTDLFLDALRRRGHEPRPIGAAPGSPATDILDAVVGRLERYLAGEPETFAGAPLDLGMRPGWDRLVLDGVRAIPWGAVSTYGRIARSIGRPGAARAVGGAVGRNPIGLLIPCHRIIAGDGSLGGYGGAWLGTREQMLAIKLELLSLEGVALPATRFAE